jgi:hypothetical protein
MSDLEVYRILETFDKLEEGPTDDFGVPIAQNSSRGYGKPAEGDWRTSTVFAVGGRGGDRGTDYELEVEYRVENGKIVEIDWPGEDELAQNYASIDYEEQAAELQRELDSEMTEGNTQVKTIGNKIQVTKDGDTTEYDDEETAAALMGDDDDNQFTTEADEVVVEGFGDYDDFGDLAKVDDGVEYSTFDANNALHRKRLQRGTPVVLSPEIMPDPQGNRTGLFVSRSPSGDYAKVIRNVDGKEVNVHLSDIVSADITNNSIYEAYNVQFEELVNEDISVTQTTNPTQPENDTVTITGTGNDVDALAAMMANAGMNSQGYQEYAPQPQTEPVVTDAGIVDRGEPEDMATLSIQPGQSSNGDMAALMKMFGVDQAKPQAVYAPVTEEPEDFDSGMQSGYAGDSSNDDYEAGINGYPEETEESIGAPQQNLSTGDPADAEEPDWYDANGQWDENGAYDAGGHYYAERDADRYMEEEGRDIEHANTPSEVISDIDAVLTGTSGGLNKPKKMYKPVAGGDNAMQRPMHEEYDEDGYDEDGNHIDDMEMDDFDDEGFNSAGKHIDDTDDARHKNIRRESVDPVDSFLNLYKAFSIRGEKRT